MKRIVAYWTCLFILIAAGGVWAEAPEADVKTFIAGNTVFAFDFYARLKDAAEIEEADGNLFFSPYSISAALAMTYAGARGDTARQMAEVLHFPSQAMKKPDSSADATIPSFEYVAAAFGRLQKSLHADPLKSGYQLNVVNALWGQKGYDFLPSFLELNRRYYSAGLKEVDFVGGTEQARQTINAWVEQQTKNKIKDLIGPRILDKLTRLVLTNAIYFKGDWAVKFKEENTRSADFFLVQRDGVASPKSVQVPMMYQKGTFAYGESDEAQILSLPYEGKTLSMLILLPKESSSLASVESSLDAKSLESDLGRLKEQEVEVFLPRFKMTCGTIRLNEILIAVGIKNAFEADGAEADFSGMTGKERLRISHVLHKAFVEVNEAGTEAAAATAVVMIPRSVAMLPAFRADRPFVFLIRENQTGSILFIGRMMNPTQ